MIILTFTSGVQMTLARHPGRISLARADETRRRPPYVIDEIFGLHRNQPLI